jgi:hypothetical protein
MWLPARGFVLWPATHLAFGILRRDHLRERKSDAVLEGGAAQVQISRGEWLKFAFYHLTLMPADENGKPTGQQSGQSANL